MKYYAYENFKHDTNVLMKKIEDYKPEVIVGIARGGLTLCHALAEGFEIREVQTIRTELYDKTYKRKTLSIFGECHFNDTNRVLVVDDIADSGETLNSVMQYLHTEFPNINFKSATLFYKKTSIYEPDFWINEANDWIDFFWERDFKQNSKI